MNQYFQAIWDFLKNVPTEILAPGINYYTMGAVLTVLLYVIFRKQLRHRRNYKARPLKTYTKQFSREFFYSFTTQIIFGITGITTYFIFKDAGFYSGPREALSWVNPIILNVVTFVILIVSHDTYFYWTHKWMHHPKVFRHVHKVHHLSKETTPLSSVSFHPLEAIIEGSWALIPQIIFPLFPIGALVYTLVELFHTVYAHAGYELYPSGFTKHWLTKHIITSTHHNMHHERVGGHYGLYFMWWDWAMKTEFDDYHTRFESLANSKLEPIQVELKQFSQQ
jgi:Delta7-sterol 5-desaturase